MSELVSPFSERVGWARVGPEALAHFALDPAEAALLSERCVASRRESFALGRAAAARAMEVIGVPRTPVLAGPIGEPRWPAGTVGSISHTRGIAVACAARAGRGIAGLGIDVERLDRRVQLDLTRRVCVASESDWVRGAACADECRRRLLRLIAAKEATFKACYPLNAVYLAFADAELVWDVSAGGFRGELRRAVSDRHPAGTRYSVAISESEGCVIAALELAG